MSGAPPEAPVKPPNRFALIWLVPLAAAALAIYLGWETLASRGPLVTITFSSGQGLSAGQTKVEHKSVDIGTVQQVTLSPAYARVVAKVRFSKTAAPMLTSHARFWVVRPRVSLTDISGLQTLVSGSYIAIDPGTPGGHPQTSFTGLDQPPGVQSDQPGRIFTLQAPRLGWLESGAPVFYHDIDVGRMIDYQEPGMGKPIRMHVFIKSPYDSYIRTDTHFWNSTGLTANLGPSGVHVAVQSVQALLAGGINFANFGDADRSPPPSATTVFHLFDSYDDAENAGFRDNIRYVTYFHQSVAGLQAGSAVQLFGIRVGTVTKTQLEINQQTGVPTVRVEFDVQPERVFTRGKVPAGDPLTITRKLVANGMRAQIDTGNLITGQEVIGLDMLPNAPPAEATQTGDLIEMPSHGGGLESLTTTLTDIASKLDAIPFDTLGSNAADLLGTLRTLSQTANTTLKPLAAQVPALSQRLEAMMANVNRLLQSLQAGYGAGSETHANLQELTTEATEAVRSVRELTNYLRDNPGAVVWGRK
jgi:paraquat-inducible protein B